MFEELAHPSDYCIISNAPEHRLSAFERLTLIGGAELEKAISWASRQFSRFPGLDRLGDIKLTDIKDLAALYAKDNFKSEPKAYFLAPQAAPVVRQTVIHGLGNGEVLDLEFPSLYQVQNQQFSVEYDQVVENKTVHVRWWRHSTPPRATIIAVHGWTMGDQRLNSLAFVPGLFYRLGLDVALIELPYHGRRRPQSAAKDISFFPSTHFVRTNEAMAQTVCDLRSLRTYLESLGVRSIGAVGMSLGGDAVALWASLDELAFCIPIVPVVSMAELGWELLSRHYDLNLLREQGMSADLLHDLYWIHSPLTHSPPKERKRLMIIAGIGDEIVPARQPKLLWDHWKRPELSWLGGGHGAQFKRAKAMQEIARFLDRLELLSPNSLA